MPLLVDLDTVVDTISTTVDLLRPLPVQMVLLWVKSLLSQRTILTPQLSRPITFKPHWVPRILLPLLPARARINQSGFCSRSTKIRKFSFKKPDLPDG
jgi:hypothetical protein